MSDLRQRTIFEMLTFKMDRTIAVAGIIILGVAAIVFMGKESVPIVTAGIGGLVAVLGAKVGK